MTEDIERTMEVYGEKTKEAICLLYSMIGLLIIKFCELGSINLSPLLKYLPACTSTGRIEAISD